MSKINFSPRLHQQNAIENAVNYFKVYDRGQLHMACGTGKTLTSLWIAKALKYHKIVILLPSLQLQEQSLNIWMKEAKYFDFELLAIGSDKSFSKKYNVDTTTDVIEIEYFLRKQGPRIIFSTYHSFHKLIEASGIEHSFDFGIIDESHNTAGNKEKKFSKLFLGDNNLIIKKRLFMTGTPKFFENGAFVSMDNEELYGKIIYNLSTDEAIKESILTNYKILVMYISENFIINQENIKQPVVLKNNKANIPLNYIALKSYVEKAVQQYGIKKILSFHNSKELANSFSKILNSILIKAYSVSSTQNMFKRNEIVDSFKKDEVSCICNPRIMLEGFDLPQIDSILFADIKKSKHDISQAIGRALRRAPQKKLSYILLPILINSEGIINKKDYNIYSEMLASMALNDVRVYNQFAFGAGTKPIIELVNPLDFTEKQVKELHDSLSVRVWKKIKRSNFISYIQLKALIKMKNITSIYQYQYFFDTCNGILQNNLLIPRRPNRFYNEWESWFEVLGYQTEPVLPFVEFKKLMVEKYSFFGINNSKKYYAWAYNKKNFGIEFPRNFPRYPNNYYKEWENWHSLYNRNKKEFLDYIKFKSEVKKFSFLKQSNIDKDYYLWGQNKLLVNEKFPENFPKSPSKYYSEWEGWLIIFEKEKKEMVDYTTFKREILYFKKILNINTSAKYFNWATGKCSYDSPFPNNFPKSPADYFKTEWEGWNKVLLNEKVSYQDFKNQIKYFSEKYGLKSGAEYLKWAKGKLNIGIEFPKNMSKYPSDTYPEWEGWQQIFNKQPVFLNYSEFLISIHFYKQNFGIDTFVKYKKWARNEIKTGVEFPNFLPRYPNEYYKEWNGWRDIFNS